MSLVESIKSAFQGKTKSAREEYRKALAQGKPVERVVALAVGAGLTEAEIAADAAIIDKAGALVESAREHPELKKKLDDAVAKYASIEGEYAAAVARFTEQLNAAGEEVEMARAAETPARKALEELTTLHHDHSDILPAPPAPVRAMLEAQGREAEIVASREAVRRARAKAGELERRLLTARNESRSPGVTNRALFSPASAAGVVGTIAQPTIAEDHAEHNAKQSAAGVIEGELAQAQAVAQQAADAHAAKFGETVV